MDAYPISKHRAQACPHLVNLQLGSQGALRDQVARTQHPSSLGYYIARGGEGERAVIAPNVTELSSGDSFAGEGWTLKCLEVPHVQPYLGCLGFRLDAQEKSFCYSGDASLSRSFMRLCEDADVLVHMCHRISNTGLSDSVRTTSAAHMDVAEFAAGAEVKTCVLSHISEQMDVPGVPERLLREIGSVSQGHSSGGKIDGHRLTPKPKPLTLARVNRGTSEYDPFVVPLERPFHSPAYLTVVA